MKKYIYALGALLLLSSPAFASHEEVGSAGVNGDTFCVRAVKIPSGDPICYIECQTGTTPKCNIKTNMLFNNVPFNDFFATFADADDLAAFDERINEIESAGVFTEESEEKLNSLPTGAALAAALLDKQDHDEFLDELVEEAALAEAGHVMRHNAAGDLEPMMVTEYGVELLAVEDDAELSEHIIWDDIPNKPTTFPPSAHNHDDRYYTKTQSDAALAGKYNTPAGTTSQYVRGDGTVASFPTTLPPSAHTHVVNDLSNASAVGKNVLVAADQAAARSAINAQVSITAGAAIANGATDGATNAQTDAPTDSKTDYNVLTTVLGTLTDGLNTTNTKQNQISAKYNDLAGKYNALAGKYNDLATKVNTIMAQRKAQGMQTP